MSSKKTLNIKLVKSKPQKVYAVSLNSVPVIAEFVEWLEGTKDKKLEVIINGKLFKFGSGAAKGKFLEGLGIAAILNPPQPPKEQPKPTQKPAPPPANPDLKRMSDLSDGIRVIELEHRVVELEETCGTLRSLLDAKEH